MFRGNLEPVKSSSTNNEIRGHAPSSPIYAKLLSRLSSQNLKSGQSLGKTFKNLENTILGDVRCGSVAGMSRKIVSAGSIADREPGSIVDRGIKMEWPDREGSQDRCDRPSTGGMIAIPTILSRLSISLGEWIGWTT